MLQQRHNAAASRKAAGRRDEGLSQRGRRRAGCRSVWKRHDYERHRPGERHSRRILQKLAPRDYSADTQRSCAYNSISDT